MISILMSATTLVAVKKQKLGVKPLFTMPINIEDGGVLGVAQRYKQRLRQGKIRDKRVQITLLENIIYKEFSHVPTSQKAAAGYAVLEARTVLREQARNYIINHIDYGKYQNKNNEEVSLLLAAPTALLKALQTAFLSCGFSIHGIHSAFDAYMAACNNVAVPLMGKKSFVAIDFGLEHTVMNVYCNGLLASQRRLHGYSTALTSFIMADTGCSEIEAVMKLRETALPEQLHEKVKEALLSFIWDTLRTVRVVTAPLSVNLDEFFLSGDMCENKALRTLLAETLELPCTFASDVDCSSLRVTTLKSSLFMHAGAALSPMDLLAEIRIAKKNTIFDVGVCATLTIIVAIGLLTQPFVLLLRNSALDSAKSNYQALHLVKDALDRSIIAASKISGIASRKEALAKYASNAGETLPATANLFTSAGLTLGTLSYDGLTGTYNISFTADSKETFLKLKDKIYANPEYYLNLNLSTAEDESGTIICTLTFVPVSFKAPPAISDAEQIVTEEVDVLEDIANEK